MRRGRIFIYLAILGAAVTCSFSSVARADGGGGPSVICADLQDGKLDGSYTQDQWNAFMSDPTVQGYCSVIVPPCVYPGQGGSGGGSGTGGTGTTCTPATPPTTPSTPSTPTPTPTVTPSPTVVPAPVPLTPQQPVVIVAVKGAQHTTTKPTTTAVKGAQHTVSATAPSKAAIAPISTTKVSGTLPFTGAQLALFALVGLALLATGLVLRSTGRPSSRR